MRSLTLYLDVDGVICPFGPFGQTGWGTEWRHANAGLLSVSFARELVDGLNGIAGIAGLRCVWLTSWEDLAPAYLCPAIGLHASQWPYLAADGAGTGESWWKLRAIQDDVDKSGPDAVVWIDDQLQFEEEAQSWARVLGRRILLVSPDPRLGITPTELASVRSYIERPVF